MRTRKEMTAEKAIVRLEELCARSEQCTSDAMKKLQTWGIGSDDADRIIESLVSHKFIDDRRFCTAYVRDKFNFAKWGKRKIKSSLAMKHLDRQYIAEALEAIDEKDYIECLQNIIIHKAKSIPDADSYEGRTRLFRFAVSRGFEPDLIASILRRISGTIR